MAIAVKVVPVGPLQMNSVILTTEGPAGLEALIIDPGGDPEKLLRQVSDSGATLTALLATHGHFDHVEGAAAIQETVDLPLHCHPDDMFLIEQMPAIQAAYGLPTTAIPRCAADLADGITVPWAGHEIPVTHVPGHSPGQVMFTIDGLCRLRRPHRPARRRLRHPGPQHPGKDLHLARRNSGSLRTRPRHHGGARKSRQPLHSRLTRPPSASGAASASGAIPRASPPSRGRFRGPPSSPPSASPSWRTSSGIPS